jgi:fructosamine-3-kinase
MSAIARAVERLLGSEVVRAELLGGGCLEQVTRFTLADGRRAVAKGGPAPPVEAAMLRAMVTAGAPAPEVLAADEQVLVMSERPNSGSLGDAWGDLGRVLAVLHAARPPVDATGGMRSPVGSAAADGPYGWDDDYAYGPIALPNERSAHWPTFWAERRLLAHVERLPAAVARRVEALASDLPHRLPSAPPAALLHGDMWSGNVLVEGDRVSGLIDPACYYGHAEVDLAMLTLFGSPDRRFGDAYGLEPGWEERRPIYQLWPGMVHLILFGSGYRRMVEGLLAAARA